MSGGSSNSRSIENWQSGQDFWIYPPPTLQYFIPPSRSLYFRRRTIDPRWLFEDRFLRGEIDFSSRPAHPRLRGDPASSYARLQPRPIPDHQNQALKKLRKQLYTPHLNNIMSRVSAKSSGAYESLPLPANEWKRCPVCLEDFESRQFLSVTPCNHMFHEECIVPWLKSSGKCPVCRFEMAERRHFNLGRSGE